MMLNFLETINGVIDYTIYDNKLIYLSNECQISTLPSLEIEKLVTDKNYPGNIFIIGDLLVWQDMFGKSTIFDMKSDSIIFANPRADEVYTFRRVDIINKGLIVLNRRINGKKELCFFDFERKDFEPMTQEIHVSIGSGEFMLNIDNESNTLNSVSIEGEKLWSFSISGEYFDIRGEDQKTSYMGTLGIHNGVLWIWLSSGELIGLDEKTGELTKRIRSGGSKDNPEFKFGGAMQIDADTSSLIGLWSKYYIEINLNDPNLSVKYTDLSESLEAISMSISYRSHAFPYDTKSIYFCDDRQGKIGVFDRGKKEIVWSYELDMRRDGIAQILEMKYADNKWYILDRNNTLHIFEKA